MGMNFHQLLCSARVEGSLMLLVALNNGSMKGQGIILMPLSYV